MGTYQNLRTRRGIIDLLNLFFTKNYNSVVMKPFVSPMGAATYHKETIDYVFKNKNSVVSFYQPCYRPFDKTNLNVPVRLPIHVQYQILMPGNICGISVVKEFLESINSLDELSVFEDNWTAPAMGAFGKGWECRGLGLEIAQITYFEKFGTANPNFNTLEIVFGVERLFSFVTKRTGISSDPDLIEETLKEVNMIEIKNTEVLLDEFSKLLKSNDGEYDSFLYANNVFNILDSRSIFTDYEKNFYLVLLSKLFNSYTEKNYK